MKLTREQILALPPGRDCDLAVAEHVLGQAWQGGNPVPGYDGRWPWPPPYSTDVAAAWRVVEHMAYELACPWKMAHDPAGWGKVTFHRWVGSQEDGDWTPFAGTFNSFAEIPLAVCRAALLAVLEETP